MRPIVTSLMAAALLFHALHGCCREFALNRVPCENAAFQVAESNDCCHPQRAGKEQQNPPAPCKSQPNCKGVCTYLPAETTQFDTPQLIADLLSVTAGFSDARIAGPPQPTMGWLAMNSSAATLPMRLHLLKGLLLI